MSDWHPKAVSAPYGRVEAIGYTEVGAVEIVGWARGDWLLDLRVDEEPNDFNVFSCWALTHIPTGWFCCTIRAPLSTAKAIAEEVAAWGDWAENNTPEKIRAAFSPQAKATRDKYPHIVRFGRVPLWSQVTHDLRFAAT